MAVAPNSTVRVLRNVPIDQDYRNTLYFASTDAQYNYFYAQTKYTFTELTYQRRESSIYVQVSPDALFDCNYIMYQNTNYNTRWFYAFITAINYVNDNTAEIVFQMDVIQSWWGNWELEQCFVERQHTTTDNIGDNLLADGLALGDYQMNNVQSSVVFTNQALKITVASTFDENFESAQGNVVGSTYSALHFTQFDLNQENEVNEFIQQATEKQLSDGIVSIFISPILANASGTEPFKYTFNTDKDYSPFGNYTPKNNKLYTSPYNMVYVFTDDGSCANYAYEYFSSPTGVTFDIYVGYSASPDAVLVPTNYKGAELNLNEKISLGGFPQCAYNIDSYKAWLAQNGDGFNLRQQQTLGNGIASSIGSLVGLLASIQSPQTGAGQTTNQISQIGGGIISSASAIMNTMLNYAQDQNTLQVMERMPNAARGSSTGGATFTNGLKNFYMCNMRIREEYARNIDSFWTMYGYPIRRVQTPNIHARPQFTYVKTQGCFVRGYMPASDIQRIERIFDNGITFWVNAANVGNYSVDNSPT